VAVAATEPKGSPDGVLKAIEELYEQRESAVTEELMRRMEQYVLLNAIDSRWKDHLKAIDALKAGIGLRGYGQVDPKMEYKKEGFELFSKLYEAIEDEVASLVLRIRAKGEEDGDAEAPQARVSAGAEAAARAASQQTQQPQLPPAQVTPIGKRMAARFQAEFERTGELPLPKPPSAEEQKKRQSALRSLQLQQQAELRAKQQAEAEERQRKAQEEAAMKEKLDGIGRNEPCPCGSGKKYKKCHGQGKP